MSGTIALICTNPDYFSSKRFIQEIQKRNFKYLFIHPGQFCAGIDHWGPFSQDTNLVLNRTTGVSFDDVDLSLLAKAKSLGIPYSNPLDLFDRFRNKDRQQFELKSKGLNVIPTGLLRGDKSETFLQQDRPYYIKTIRGNGGRGVERVAGNLEATSLLNSQWKNGDQRYLIQPEIPGVEWRVLLVGNEVYSSFSKERERFIFETSVPKEILHQVEIYREHFPGHFVALDFLHCKQSTYLLEVNLVPGVEKAEAASNLNIIGAYLDWCLKNL